MQYYHIKLAFARGKYGCFARKMKESELQFAKKQNMRRAQKEKGKREKKYTQDRDNGMLIIDGKVVANH